MLNWEMVKMTMVAVALTALPFSVVHGDAEVSFAPMQAERYEPLWKRSPFTLATAENSGPGAIEQRYALSSVALIDDKPFVVLADKSENNRSVMAERVSGMEVVSVDIQANAAETTVVLKQGGQQATLRFDKTFKDQRRASAVPTPPVPGKNNKKRTSSKKRTENSQPARPSRVIRRTPPVPSGANR